MRHGFSLLELLIAIFVILVGLLGVVALIPVGHRSMLEATQHDRARTLAASSIQEVQTRGWIRPEWWCWPDGADFDETVTTGWAVAIDPLYVGANAPDAGTEYLPFGIAAGLPRLTLWAVPPVPGATPPFLSPVQPMSSALAERLFRAPDDLLFSIEEDQRAKAVPGTTQAIAAKGEYSYFFTVSPNVGDMGVSYQDKEMFSVSTVVCYQRNVAKDGPSPTATRFQQDREIQANVVWPGGTYNGEVRLVFSSLDDADRVNESEWIALYRADRRAVMWYRIIAIDDVDGTQPMSRYVTLGGPDWFSDPTQPAPQPPMPATAIIVPSAISVSTAHLVMP